MRSFAEQASQRHLENEWIFLLSDGFKSNLDNFSTRLPGQFLALFRHATALCSTSLPESFPRPSAPLRENVRQLDVYDVSHPRTPTPSNQAFDRVILGVHSTR
ncbi:hypothetical protein CRV24_010062 [Beauveria bassiana]|nr:hypothetical protein CRV24_010062 [Beauveria bassiana]